MKKLTLIVMLFALTWQVTAQNYENSLQNRNEIKLDPVYLLLSILKVEYEYLLNDWSSMGLVALYNFSNREEMIWQTQVLGLYRLYFGKMPASGFFLEGGLGVTSGYTFPISFVIGPSGSERYTAFGANIAVGWKWYIPKSGVTLDLVYGIGRLYNNDDPLIYPRMGILVGKRF